ncbi:MAG: PIN domain-containing protein, partial [Ilumatobacteraceae bacterium]
ALTTFVDTNVFVYSFDANNGAKQERAQNWLDHLWSSRSGRLSTQVMSEFYVTATRKLNPSLSLHAAHAELRQLVAWRPVAISHPLVQAAWSIEERFGLSYWDALIVAAARRSRSECLLTEELQDGQDLDGVVIVDPFRHEP